MRKVFFWIHLTAGVVAGLVILVMSVTGALLALRAADHALRRARAADGRAAGAARRAAGARGAAASVAARSGRRRGRAPITLDADPDAPPPWSRSAARASLHSIRTRARVLGEGSTRARARSSARSPTGIAGWRSPGRAAPTGKAVTGACNVAFLFLVRERSLPLVAEAVDARASCGRSSGSRAGCPARRATSTGTTRSASGRRP